MTESMLTALMKLFAILANLNRDVAWLFSRNFVESYLKTQFTGRIVEHSLVIFDKEAKNIAGLEGLKETKRISALSVKILAICNQINNELHVKNKFLIVLSLIKFLKFFDEQIEPDDDFRQTLSDAVLTISEYLQISKEDYENCRMFTLEKFYKVPGKDNLLVISDIDSFSFTAINHLQKEKLNGQLFFLKIQQAGLIIFYYSGKESLELTGKYIFPHHIYILPKGASLKGGGITPVYYSDVEAGFLRRKAFEKISFLVRDIEFRFPQSDNGIHKMSFGAESGDLMGIMGGSGVGKSTLIKVLNGIYKTENGNIFINGHDIDSGKNQLKGMIGYVPQDDLLIEELTVYQNLYYKARLCLGNMNESQIHKTVLRILNDLDLFYIKDLIVGSPLNKLISGGQRKRLNIALELVMEPYILFADEPTSGLSSTDAGNVMQLLNELTLQGKIVFVNIHQPSSELFKMLDKIIVLDKGGFPVYIGNPLDSFSYLINITKRVDPGDIECAFCGNVQPDEILEIIEAKQVNELGEFTGERLIPPEKWYEYFLDNIQNKQVINDIQKTKIPALKFKLPGFFSQFLTYSERNLFTKITDRQFIFLAILIAPVLAFIVSTFSKYFSRYASGTPMYVFGENVNMPAYIFMSVIVALFIGLIISAEEIIKDKKTLEREKFLDLSRASYLNSKLVFLFLLSAFQMLVYVIVGNHILEIKGLTFHYWLVLFSTSCFAIMLGLNISSAFKSIVSIYINIPFILVPLILLAGVIVKYDKLHYRLASTEHVPVAGDLMASRWAYEALMVTQFRDNKYQKQFFPIDRDLANVSWELNFLIPALNNKVNDYERFISREQDTDKTKDISAKILRTVKTISDMNDSEFSDFTEKLSSHPLNVAMIKAFTADRRSRLIARSNELVKQKDKVFAKLRLQGMSSEDIADMKGKYYNQSVADLVLNLNEMAKIVEVEDRFIRKDTPVYQFPVSKYGRAHFYSGTRRIGPWIIDTLWFNVSVLWLMTGMLFLNLLFDLSGRLSRISLSIKKK